MVFTMKTAVLVFYLSTIFKVIIFECSNVAGLPRWFSICNIPEVFLDSVDTKKSQTTSVFTGNQFCWRGRCTVWFLRKVKVEQAVKIK